MDLQLPMQSVFIITKVVSSNPVHGEVYSIQLYVIKFVSDLWQDGRFLLVHPVSSTNKTGCHDITEILLEVALNIITWILLSYRFRIIGLYVLELIKSEVWKCQWIGLFWVFCFFISDSLSVQFKKYRHRLFLD